MRLLLPSGIRKKSHCLSDQASLLCGSCARQRAVLPGIAGSSLNTVCASPHLQCLLNVVTDSTTGLLGFAILARDSEGRGQLFRTAGRIFGGFSDTAKAFIIIASTDILLGCATLHPGLLRPTLPW